MAKDNNQSEMSVRRRRVLEMVGVGGAAGLAGCTGGQNGGGDTTTEGGDVEPREYNIELDAENANPDTSDVSAEDIPDGGELVATFGADVAKYDPVQQTDTTSVKATDHIYETLLTVDWEGSYHNVLAESFEQVDETTYEVSVRQGVTFHNGDELTAQDVQVSLDRYEGAPNEADVFTWYDSSEVLDDYTIQLNLKNAYGPLQNSLAAVPIVPQAAESGDVDLEEGPVGTGPYQFVEHEEDTLWRIERNEDHWFEGNDTVPETPPIETVTYRIVVESSAQVAAIRGGDVDIINSPQPSSIADLQDNGDVEVTTALGAGNDQIFYPLGVTPFDNVKVRQGVTRLIPRESIVEAVYNNTSIPAYGAISPMLGDYSPVSLHEDIAGEYAGYHPEAAKQLIQEGFEEAGIEAPFDTTIITNENPQRVQWCQLIKESMEATGLFNVSIDQFEWNTYLDRVNAEDSHQNNELIALGWSGGFDPHDYVFNLFYSENASPACCNTNSWSNDEADSLIETGMRSTDKEERVEAYKDLQWLIAEQAPVGYIQFSLVYDVIRPDRVKNWHTYPNDSYEFEALYAPHVDQVAWVEE